jgi:PAS domain S-box-containing protein
MDETTILDCKTILLVENDHDVCLTEAQILRNHGYDVITAQTGEKAIETVRKTACINLILMDIDLGTGMDGAETARQILSARTVPIVFLISQTEPERINRVRGITHYGYVMKNADEAILRSSIEMACELFNSHEKTRQSEERYRRITEEEEALEDSEAKYRAIVESSLVGAYIVQDGVFRYVTNRWCEIYGYSSDEIVDKVSPLDLTPVEDWKLVDDSFQKRLSGEVDRIEYRPKAIRKDGTIITVHVLGSLMIYKGRPAISGTVMDVTEWRKWEEALCASQLQLSEAMDLAHIVYWDSDPATHTFIFNDPFYAFYGTTAEQEGGYRMSMEDYSEQFMHPDDLKSFSQFVEQNSSHPGPELVADMEHRIIRRDGQVRYIMARTRIVKDDSGRIVKRYGANQDITERKEMEKELQEREEQFREMFQGNPMGMVMAGADFRIIRANAAFCRMLGYTEQELSGLTFPDITYPEHVTEDTLGVTDLIIGKIPIYRTEKRYIRKDKGVVWASVTVNIMRGGDDRFLYLFTTVEDITQRRQAEEEKTRLEEQLRQAQKMEAVGTLAGGVAHDFNNLLTVIMGFSNLIQMSITKDDRLSPYVEQIVISSQKAADLTQSLLAFSRKQRISPEPHNVNDVITSSAKLLRRLLPEDIELRLHLTDDKAAARLDITQIDQVLMNFAVNGRDAMPRGGLLTISTNIAMLDEEFERLHGFGKPGMYVKLSVSDTGIGMDEKIITHIFEPFFTTKEVGKGTGLGLASVYGIIKQHDGFITVSSTLRKGTTFDVYLPALDAPDQPRAEQTSRTKGGTETVLIVDDDPGVRNMLARTLESKGYSIIEATNGKDAVEVHSKHKDQIDLVILDVVMPGQNGKEAFDEIVLTDPRVKAIFMSGYTGDIVIDKGIESENIDFLQKPLSVSKLLSKVREVLDR